MFSMKKSLSLLRLLTAAILLSASGGCSETNDPDPEGGGDPPVKEPVTYTITLGETSEQGAAVKVTPSDETATYYCGIHSEASLLGIPTATLLRQIASLDDLDERLHTGTEEFTIAETLTPVTSYKIVVAGYDGKEFTGDIALSEAFAVEPPAGPAAFTFEVKEKSFDNTVIDITPLAAEVPYFAEVKEAAVCDAMTDDAIISEILNLYGSMAEWFTYTGPTTITSSGDFGTLVPGTDYYVLAFGYADGAAATELTKHKFTTDPEGDPTANTFAFDISGVTARSASIQVEPSDKSVRYIWDIVTDAEYKKYGGNAEGIRSYLADYIKGQIDDFFTTPEEVVSVIGVRGDQWFDYEQLKPATTYYVWAACVDAAGNATATPAVSSAFTTEAAVVSTATATVEFEKYYNGSELYAIDDVTYKKHMEEKLTEDEKLAYTGKLAADVAHEIRNPLAGIRAGIQVVSRKLGEERDRKLCGGMVREVDRVNLLIENLLNLSRRRESEKTTVSLNALFEELQMLYFKVAENKGILFNALVNGRLWLYADEGELRQVLINLINNSVKAMPDGGELAIRAWKEEDGVALSVVDTGVGMTQEKLHKVLGEGGTGGLGLSIVQRLLAQNGGVLSMDSTPGAGTRAQIRFPHKGGTA